MSEKTLYEGDDVICKEPWEIGIIEGYSGVVCRCGFVLHIKTPKHYGWRAIKCPKCGFIVNLFCGEEGEPVSLDEIRSVIPSFEIPG